MNSGYLLYILEIKEWRFIVVRSEQKQNTRELVNMYSLFTLST